MEPIDVDQQIKTLIDEAPQDGVTPILVEAIAPVLQQIASQLRHPHYYIVQTLDHNWTVTTLAHQTQAGVEKRVIYAFPSLKDVSTGPYPMRDPHIIALPVPTTHILFQMVALDMVDSIIFFETAGNTSVGTEIAREDVQAMVQQQLQGWQPPQRDPLPPDIA
jgi:hypothetical protein